jgi:two-component system, OmpR family, heavy metal sensor histidine kinase CusS
MTDYNYSIGRRLSRQIAVQTAIGLSVLCAGIFWAADMLLDAKHEEQIQGHITLMQDVAIASAAKGGVPEVLKKLEFYTPRRPGTFLEVKDAGGNVVFSDGPEVRKKMESFRAQTFTVQLPESQGGTLTGLLKLDCAPDARLLAGLGITLLLATLGGAAAAGWGTYWRVRRALRPLKDLAKQTRAIDAQRLDQRLNLNGPVAEELAPWVNQFNALMQRLERSYTQLEGFNADVAHELRTPLANLIGQTEVTLARERSPEVLRDTMISNLEELQRLSAMVNDMLFLASADRGATARRDKPVSLAELARQVVEFHEAPLEDAKLKVQIEGDALVAVDEPLFKRALSNLVGNATRFGKPGSLVRIQISSESAEELKVTVENAGEAIDAQQLPRLFDRFFRADSSRCCEGEEQHHGLGLAIVAAIARMHAGRTLAESREGLTRIGFTLATH